MEGGGEVYGLVGDSWEGLEGVERVKIVMVCLPVAMGVRRISVATSGVG